MLLGHSSDRALQRPAHPEWVRTLQYMTPPSERISSLVIRWHGGTMRRASPFRKAQWVPSERWVIYQRCPSPATPPVLCTPPSGLGRRVQVRPRHPNLVRGLLDRVQWDLYLETGHYYQLYWVIQGREGGHRRNYDRMEEQLAQLLRLPQEPPALGALAYAEPNQLTWSKLYELDVLRRYKRMLALDKRPYSELAADERAARVEMRMKMLRSMDERAYESVSGNMDEWRAALACSNAQLDNRLQDNTAEIEAAERDFVLHDN